MDAKITKPRLSNLLAYDWLKILVSIVVAVVALAVIFTMAATRPTNAQTFTVYGYSDLRMGSDGNLLEDDLTARKTFSYDILDIGVESFYGNSYSGATFSARRAAGEGTVMFVSAYDTEGKTTVNSELYKNTVGNVYAGDGYAGYYQPQFFLETEIGEYLIDFFGDDLTGEPDAEMVQKRFMLRNGKDKRFRSAAKKAEGIESETARLKKLRDDYLALRAAFESNVFAYTALKTEEGETQGEAIRLGWGETCPEGYYIASVDVSGVRRISQLFYYTNEELKPTGESVNLLVFHNSRKQDFDLCYETVSFLNYLVEKYNEV